MVLLPVLQAAETLASQGIGSKIISVVSPRRLYRPTDIATENCAQADTDFLSDSDFDRLFGGDALLGITGGSSAMLEPVILRSKLDRDVICWKRGETCASADQVMALNGLSSERIVGQAQKILA